ncbi:MAG: acetoin utilization protein AcuC [Anaerolineae bacterium]|nr:acetoin utilization protein AcuC [Anaerolineae bacterium]
MAHATALIFHDIYRGRGFSPLQTSWNRYSLGYDLMASLGLFDNGVAVLRPTPATEAELRLAHTPEYIAEVRQADSRGEGFLDRRDTPAWRGVFERATTAVGGTLLAAHSIMAGDMTHAFNPAGGLHHAQADRASGFCIFNDLVIATRVLQRDFGLTRIATIDIDGHHGDGVQALLYDEPVLKISFHQYDGRFYPGTGAVDELGTSAGHGYSVNVPLPRRVGDASYLAAFDALVPPLLYSYRPQFILVQFGVDAHVSDPLVGLWLTTAAYQRLVERLHELAHDLCDGRLLFLGGGGYNPPTVARCWAILVATLSGALPTASRDQYAALFDQETPTEAEVTAEQVRAVVAEVQSRLLAVGWRIPSWRPAPPPSPNNPGHVG